MANRNTPGKLWCHVLEDFCFRVLGCANNKFQSNIKWITELHLWLPEQPAPISVQHTHGGRDVKLHLASLPDSATRRQHRRRGPPSSKGKQACELNTAVRISFIFLGFFFSPFIICPQMCLMLDQGSRIFPCPLMSRTNSFSVPVQVKALHPAAPSERRAGHTVRLSINLESLWFQPKGWKKPFLELAP